MKKFIVGIMALALIMVGSFTASAEAFSNHYSCDECTYAEGMMVQGLITGVAISDVSVYTDAFVLGGLSVDTIALQGMRMSTGASNHGGICGSDMNLDQTLSIETEGLKINMTQTGVSSSTRTCGDMMR